MVPRINYAAGGNSTAAYFIVGRGKLEKETCLFFDRHAGLTVCIPILELTAGRNARVTY
jgi:hypothetical protein